MRQFIDYLYDDGKKFANVRGPRFIPSDVLGMSSRLVTASSIALSSGCSVYLQGMNKYEHSIVM